jgi:hypothetical protein
VNIVQSCFVVPPEIEAGLNSGEYIRYGGVVRNGAGQLVKHLKELPLSDSGEVAARRLLKVKHPLVIAIVGLILVVAIAIATMFALLRRRRARTLIANYNASFMAYLTAAANGTLDEALIDHLIADSDAINGSSDNGKVRLVLSTEQSEALMNLISDYTRSLAESNSVPLAAEQAPAGATVTDLRHHLEAQRHIFRRAA